MILALAAMTVLSAEPKAVRFALTPFRPADEMATRYRPLADRIEKQTNTTVQLIVAPDFGAAASMLLDGRADLAELSAVAFVKGMERGKMQPLVADAMTGNPGTGIIFSRSEAGLIKLEQLKGVKFGFVDPLSSTGFLGPWANLQARGVDPASIQVHFVGNNDAVLKQVLAGDLDAGAVSRAAYEEWLRAHPRGADAIDAFRVMTDTSRMPGDVICASEKLSPELTTAMTTLLLGLQWDAPADRKVLEPAARKGYQHIDLKDYAWLLRVAATIKQKP